MRTGNKRQYQLFQYVLERVASGRREEAEDLETELCCIHSANGVDCSGRVVYKAIDLAQYLQ
jgi:hypothetical protein